jgi:uncharacterized surface anchored protein
MEKLFYVGLLISSLSLQVPAPVAALKDGVIEVVVRDSATGLGIAGARISFVILQNPPPNIVSSVNADDNGQAVFRDLAPGNYRVVARSTGYIDSTAANPSRTIGPDAKKHRIELTLTRGASVSGRVLDPLGVPVAGVQVGLTSLGYREGKIAMSPAAPLFETSRTDDRGEYRISGLPAGTYYVQAGLRSIDEQGWVGYWDDYPKLDYYYPGVSDLKAAVPVNIRGSQDMTAIDIRLPNVRTFKISGTVVNPVPGGRALPNGQTNRLVDRFYLTSTDPERSDDAVLVPATLTPSANPDESVFMIRSVLPGSYYLFPVWDPGLGSSTGWLSSRTAIQIEARDVEGLRIVLKPNNQIKGRLLFDGNFAPAGPNALRVGLRRLEPLPGPAGGSTLPSATVPDVGTGEFTLANVPNGRFSVNVGGIPQDAYIADVRENSRSVFNEGFVAGGDEKLLEVVINLQGGAVQGVVRDAAGAPVARAGVTLVPAGARRRNPQLYKRTTSEADGQFRLRGVSPGEYKVFAWATAPAGQAEENPQYIAQYENRGQIINVTAGTPFAAQVQVIPSP